MEKSLFEPGTDIDVEALMLRVRESARQPGMTLANALSPRRPRPRILKELRPQRLTQEIHSAALSAEVINQLPLKSRGTKGFIEFRVKKFFKWLVHWNTGGQVEFNHSVMRSLELIAEDLQTGQDNFAAVEDLLRDSAAQSSELERMMNQVLEEVRQKVRSEIAPVEARPEENLDRNS